MSVFSLANRTALVTGASSGLGEHFAHVLAQAGASVVMTPRTSTKPTDSSTRQPRTEPTLRLVRVSRAILGRRTGGSAGQGGGAGPLP